MTRKVVIVGFPGVQALDVVGPHDVFTGASLLTG
ncbi:MAG TPA: GlxA family transcriptional regulator, partial [Mycobacterium sp.]|nr:GlxA family transcriptional regulator [Mycobacterium sp.]